MVHLHTTLGEQLLDISVGQAEAQVPADRQHDDVGREAEAGKGRSRKRSWASAAASHTGSLAASTRSPGMQQCLGDHQHVEGILRVHLGPGKPQQRRIQSAADGGGGQLGAGRGPGAPWLAGQGEPGHLVLHPPAIGTQPAGAGHQDQPANQLGVVDGELLGDRPAGGDAMTATGPVNARSNASA
jgi:hypothetical protein